MKLNVQDRLILLSVLPSEGDLVTLRVVRDLHGELGFSEEEIAQIGLKAEDGGYAWRSEANTYEKDVQIGPKACEVVVRAFLRRSTRLRSSSSSTSRRTRSS